MFLFCFFNCSTRFTKTLSTMASWITGKSSLAFRREGVSPLMFVMIHYDQCCLALLVTCSALSFVSSHWLTRVIIPSGHAPLSDGLKWDVCPLKKDLIPVWQTLLRHTCSLIQQSLLCSNCSGCLMVLAWWLHTAEEMGSFQPPIPQRLAAASLTMLMIFHQWKGNVSWKVSLH